MVYIFVIGFLSSPFLILVYVYIFCYNTYFYFAVKQHSSIFRIIFLSSYQFGLKASRRILQKAKLVRSPKSPKQLVSPKKKTVAVLWHKCEVIALVQFMALFGEFKEGKWPTFGGQHEYWEKAAAFIQETAGTSYQRSSKF